jgi:hypothetical protein
MKKQSPFDLSWKHLYFLTKLLSVYVRLLWLKRLETSLTKLLSVYVRLLWLKRLATSLFL